MSATERVGTACAALPSGGVVAVTDDPGREDEVDLIVAAEHATPQNVACFLGHTSGYQCVSMSEERPEALQLHPMRGGQGDRQLTAFLVTVDLHRGAAAVLGHPRVGGVELTTNNPDKVQQLRDLGVVVRDRNPVHSRPTAHHLRHLTTKRDRMGHPGDSTPRLLAEGA